MDYTVTTSVFATTEAIGFHRWPSAPDEVSYLRNEHRHKFGVRVELSVVEDDREVEFHILRRQLDGVIWMGDVIDSTAESNFGTQSCEAIAHDLLSWLRSTYPGRSLYRVTVDEDGENGATVEAVADEVGTRLDYHLDAHRGDDR